MKIFITSIAGFLGSHLAKKLKKLVHEISGNDNLLLGEIENLQEGIIFKKRFSIFYRMVCNMIFLIYKN